MKFGQFNVDPVSFITEVVERINSRDVGGIPNFFSAVFHFYESSRCCTFRGPNAQVCCGTGKDTGVCIYRIF